ncbi:MAG: 16S rRNA (guanine(966)-N(2))-methyltransferase RsmD [Deltaproteobacteria bacterium]|nr:16S rRNA (guanine(966)-N(2))-methyltransferase RsmD [Deltaproteobacteria bacterium]
MTAGLSSARAAWYVPRVRLTGGGDKGRRLRAVPKSGVRPTSARVRAAIFNLVGQDLSGVRVLDLFAGVGTIGLEALSRGASHVVFVERSAQALKTLRANVGTAGALDRATIVGGSLGRSACFNETLGPFQLVIADPPYRIAGDVSYLVALLEANLVSENARIVIEHGTRVVPPDVIGPLALLLRRRYGDTVLSIYGKSDRRERGG